MYILFLQNAVVFCAVLNSERKDCPLWIFQPIDDLSPLKNTESLQWDNLSIVSLLCKWGEHCGFTVITWAVTLPVGADTEARGYFHHTL